MELEEIKENKLYFFRASDKYIEFLREIEPKVMYNRHEDRYRIYLGVLINIGIHQYYAPLTSYKEETHGDIKNGDQKTFIIKGTDHENKESKLALISLINMFPVIQTELTLIDFEKEEEKYKALLEKEYSYVLSNQEKIIKRAKKLHQLVTRNKVPALVSLCNDFTKLEREYIKFGK